MIIGARGINFNNEISSFNTKLYSAVEPTINNKCYQNVTDNVNVVKAIIDSDYVYKDKVIAIGFCDTDEEYILDKGTKVLMRNGTYKPAEQLHFGDLCMTKSEIKPLKHVGEVRYVSEIYPDDDLVTVDVQNKSDNKSIENVALTNGVYVKL